MDVEQAVKALKEIERHANASAHNGMYNQASTYFEGIFFKIADEARKKQWIDEETYSMLTFLEPNKNIEGLVVVGCASTLLMRFLEDERKKNSNNNNNNNRSQRSNHFINVNGFDNFKGFENLKNLKNIGNLPNIFEDLKDTIDDLRGEIDDLRTDFEDSQND